MAQLVFLKNDKKVLSFPLRRGETTLGRQSTCDITLEGTQVSRLHAVVSYDGGFYQIQDRSKNGLRLNGKTVRSAKLEDKDRIEMGEWILQFLAGSDDPATETVTVTKTKGVPPKGAQNFDLPENGGPGDLLGISPVMKKVFQLVGKVADSEATVLLLGETGSGKEVVAQAIHRTSKRALLPFVPVNCAAISPQLVESELFGHEKGSFTGATQLHRGAFEQAEGGTLFLDEVGEIPLDLQPKLLRALESLKIKRVGGEKEIFVKCRVIAATHRNLTRVVQEGGFREDLYYRLFVMPVEIPPLRQRREDIPLLAEHFLCQMRPDEGAAISREASEKLKNHLWPDNVRELKNVILRSALLAGSEGIQGEHIVFLPQSVSEEKQEPQTIGEMEKEMILEKLRQTDWNKAAAARELGLAVSTIFKKIKEYDLKK